MDKAASDPALDPSSDYAVARRLTAWAHQVREAMIRETVVEAADRFHAVVAERDALREALATATTWRTSEDMDRARDLLGKPPINRDER